MQALMDFLDNFIYGPLDVFDRLEGLLKGVYYRDSGHRFAMLKLEKGGKHTRSEVEELLTRYGIAVYGRTFDATYKYFLVKKRQAKWAEYLMLHAGVQLHGPLVDYRNAHYVSEHASGWMPQPWSAWEEHDDTGATPKAHEMAATAEQTETNDVFRTFKKLVEW